MAKELKVVLEAAALKFAQDTDKPPYLFDLSPEKGRETVDDVQSGDIKKLEVDMQDLVIEGGPSGHVPIRLIRPTNVTAKLPIILYIHGAGWVFGNAHTHDRLIRELAVGTDACVVFPKYSLSPEAKYPKALEEIYAVLQWIAYNGKDNGFDTDRLYIAGDSVGGNMSAAITLMAKDRGGPRIHKQLLFYPVTDSSLDTESYKEFATGYFLRQDGMAWFWEQYVAKPSDKEEIYAAPLRATIEQLTGLPQALIITAEADVLRDEGEAYANKLREAGVHVTAVRFQGIIHDFVMLNDLANTAAARGAIALANSWLKA
ncbi:alpha/beta hydrolase [Paenibacillus qinlingensis]|uniref:alpha/beta hydrolase n=1 Tax=Paenibacillus qinlingensis TaxID=1837343 RepID=UPI0015648DF0|nr:alpha/beta hydrolase [Paenibacillus qinlingensis]NQX62716.1 alpha/beta hydrolase [Paenibacillus qinlingensis]